MFLFDLLPVLPVPLWFMPPMLPLPLPLRLALLAVPPALPVPLALFMFPPVFALFAFIAGVVVVAGEAVVFMVVFVVVFVVVLPVLFVFSLAQPTPKAMTASKVRRAKVLRIEFVSC
jgi:hypothetical protein